MPVNANAIASSGFLSIPAGSVELKASLEIPPGANSLVLIVDSTGDGLGSPHNHYAARALREMGLGTMIVELLTEGEAANPRACEDVRMLTERILWLNRWIKENEATKHLRLGFLGGGAGTPAALCAAAEPDARFDALVFRGGNPEKAWTAIPRVQAPTMFIVGGRDLENIMNHRMAYSRLLCKKDWKTIEESGPDFGEAGAFEQMVWSAIPWFKHNL